MDDGCWWLPAQPRPSLARQVWGARHPQSSAPAQRQVVSPLHFPALTLEMEITGYGR
jgi:hypothetical protein